MKTLMKTAVQVLKNDGVLANIETCKEVIGYIFSADEIDAAFLRCPLPGHFWEEHADETLMGVRLYEVTHVDDDGEVLREASLDVSSRVEGWKEVVA